MSHSSNPVVRTYHLVKRGSTSLVMFGFGILYIYIGGTIWLRCLPQMSMRHLSYWFSTSGIVVAILTALLLGSYLVGVNRTLPLAFRGVLMSLILGCILYVWPNTFENIGEMAEWNAAIASVLLVLGLMNIFEALPAGVGSQQRSLKAVEAQDSFGGAFDASAAQASGALRGKRGSSFGRRRTPDDLEF